MAIAGEGLLRSLLLQLPCAPAGCLFFLLPPPYSLIMAQAIIRVAKIKSAGAARGKTAHNYRLLETPNADPDRTKTLNEEYINTDRNDYWSLAEQRIKEVVTRKVRDDQVRAMEVILTASPEWFKRDTTGQAEDVRGGKWVAENLHFLKQKFGEKNVVSFTLHQDEKTPHIHAVVIPITEKNRLSADTLFNPKTLAQLQTDYAQAMNHLGLERGVAGSRQQHQDMKQLYGYQKKTVAAITPLIEPLAAQPFNLDSMPGLLNRDRWKQTQESAINAEISRQISEANHRLEKAGNVAVAHASSTERVEVLARQLAISEGLKQRHFTELEKQNTHIKHLAVQLVQGGGKEIEELLAYGQEEREKGHKELTQVVEKLLMQPLQNQEMFIKELEKVGWTVKKDGLFNQESGVIINSKELKPNKLDLISQLASAIKRTQREDQKQKKGSRPKF
jgi:hypothetical protein